MDADASARGKSILRWIFAFGIASTAIHYTHNFIEIDSYPGGPVGDTVVQAAILASWPVLTAVGLLGYRFYSQGRYSQAHACLIAYAPLGLLTLGHFLSGSPDIPPFFYATIFTDGISGLAVLGFVWWSISSAAGPAARVVRRPPSRSSRHARSAAAAARGGREGGPARAASRSTR